MGELFTNLRQAVITAAVPVITAFAVRWLKALQERVRHSTEASKANEYASRALGAVYAAVEYTAQTYVDRAKDLGLWDSAAQEKALNIALGKAKALLSFEAAGFIGDIDGDVAEYLKTLIEARIHVSKAKAGGTTGGDGHE